MSDTEKTVQVDLNVIFTILQNLNDIPAKEVPSTTGALIGLQKDSLLEVTNSFQFPKTNLQNYNQDICKVYSKMNFESNIVGLYTAAVFDSFMSEDFLTKLFLYQSTISECVVLVFDYVKISIGIPSIKAYKLTDKALNLLRSNDYSSNNIILKLGSFENLLCEIPIIIRMSTLTRVLVEKLKYLPKAERKISQDDESDLLDKRIYYLNRSLKDLSQEVYKISTKCKKIHSQFITNDQKDKMEYVEQMSSQAADSANMSLDYLGMIISCWNSKFLNNEVSDFVNFVKSQTDILEISPLDETTK